MHASSRSWRGASAFTATGDRPPEIRGRTVILVDDGLATGATMRAAVRALRQQQPARIVVAVPTASPETCEALKAEADEVVCAITPEPFFAVGYWYDDFAQTTDDEVRELLARPAELGRFAPKHRRGFGFIGLAERHPSADWGKPKTIGRYWIASATRTLCAARRGVPRNARILSRARADHARG